VPVGQAAQQAQVLRLMTASREIAAQ
jgi:hypothetical protein